MNRFFFTLLALGIFSAPLSAADAIAEVKRADAARVKATISGDTAGLAALLTEDLIYGHNDGRVQTKTEFINAAASNQVKYEAFDYEETKLVETAPQVVTMTGIVHLKVSRGNTRVAFGIRFLAVWRHDDGQWRLHAYQSARLPEAAPVPSEKAAP